MKKLVIGADKSGYNLKEQCRKFLEAYGAEILDVSLDANGGNLPYYEVAAKAAEAIRTTEFKRGILICGSGAGMCIAANKFEGIYAVACESVYTARMCGLVNNANVLTLGERVLGAEMACDMLKTWIETEFTQDFAVERRNLVCSLVEGVRAMEHANFSGGNK